MSNQCPDREPWHAKAPSLLKVFIVCLSSVTALFIGYEIVERTWLGGVDPKVLHTLHILRGLSAAAIAAMLATLVFLRQDFGPLSDEAPAPATGSWARRLQKVHLRTKILAPIVILAVVPAVTIGIFTISRMRDALWSSAFERVEFDTASKAGTVQGFLQAMQEDLLFLSRVSAIRDLAAAEAAGAIERAAELRRELESLFLIFSQGKRAYYQVRYLNGAGHEVVRLNVLSGQPRIAPFEDLQDKSERYYVRQGLALTTGGIYFSAMDLNVEHGEIEVPHRGVVRYATPVEGREGTGRGLLVINIDADYILSLVGPLPSGTEAWVVDEEGAYLGYVGESGENQAIYGLENRRQLSADYSPEAARAILESDRGRLSAAPRGALVSYARIPLSRGSPNRWWTLMIAQPRAPIEAPIRHLTVFLSVVMVLVLSVAGTLGIMVAHYVVRPIANLRRATREIAAGHLTRRVNVATGDELEGLASDFNTMTAKLREAHERLSAWNVELEREVKSQTEHLHQLQGALAQADKLASIGQMTAAVMHEIGNPLAAIKTKIQVAEEGESIGEEPGELLDEISHEVDRLTLFLRSFSRLARLREPSFEAVSLVETIHDVIILVGPELHRRGASLRLEAPGDVPAIRGDANQIRQLLINLILNAGEASEDHGEILVKVQREPAGGGEAGEPGRVRIEIVDHGPGMSAEVIEKIWDPFFTTKPEGTGLGLAICRQIVEEHDGQIEIRSRPGGGTTARITFPARIAGGPGAAPESEGDSSNRPGG